MSCPRYTPEGYAECTRHPDHSGPCAHPLVIKIPPRPKDYALARARELQAGAEAQASTFLAERDNAQREAAHYKKLFLDLCEGLVRSPFVPETSRQYLRDMIALTPRS